jgi:hypothetical protein
MSEHYNQVFVLRPTQNVKEVAGVFVDGLEPLWHAVGLPERLTKVNTRTGLELHETFCVDLLRKWLDNDSSAVVVARPAVDGVGSVLCYTLGSFSALTVSRPFALLAQAARRESLVALWRSICRYSPPLFAVSGRELEVSAAQIHAKTEGWQLISEFETAEFMVLPIGSKVVAANSVDFDVGRLIWLQTDAAGGEGLS